MKFKLILFTVTGLIAMAASSNAAVILAETFTYPDGPIVGAAGSPWLNNTGTVASSTVTANALNVSTLRSEDIAAPLSGTVATGVMTATFTVTFSLLPTTSGAYFTHFVATGGNQIGRLYAAIPTGTATGDFRLGIANSTTAATFSTTDLALGTAYTIVLSIDLATDITSFTIDGGAATTATDTAVDLTYNRYGFRQATGEGTMSIDNLSVDGTVVSVPEPSAALLGAVGALGLLGRRRRQA
jgi:MYXO-CTERM domain-containing protein